MCCQPVTHSQYYPAPHHKLQANSTQDIGEAGVSDQIVLTVVTWRDRAAIEVLADIISGFFFIDVLKFGICAIPLVRLDLQ